jgi:hypothetical protein
MSVVGVTALARDLEHVPGLLDRWATERDRIIAGYPISAAEADAIRRNDAAWLLAAGMNPVALRNLFVIQGIAHKDMYSVRIEP